MSGRGYMLRSGRNDWRTPDEILALVRKALGGQIDLDPCAASDFTGFALQNYAIEDDGLDRAWWGRVYVNPPFGALDEWAKKCAEEGQQGCEILLLLPARTDTRYWHQYIGAAQAVCFLRGRVRFVGAPGPCPFPVAIAYWGPNPWRFHRVFSHRGMVVVPSAWMGEEQP